MASYITKLARTLGLEKVDADAPLTLNVKELDVKRASRKDPSCCAYARACKRELKAKAAYFFRTTAWVQHGDKLVRYSLPPSMQKEIVAFDRNKTMEPGTYQLSPPVKSARMGAVMKRSKKRSGRHQPGKGTIKRKFVHRTENIRGTLPPV